MSKSHGLRLALTLWLLSAPCLLLAAQALHWDVKGAVLGSTFDELRNQVQVALYCYDVTSGADFKIGIDEECHETNFKVYTFAGQETHIFYGLHQGILWKIKLSNIRPNAFDSVVATMESKYGKANVVKSDIQNRMGAHFTQAIASWVGLDHIEYKKYADTLDKPSTLYFYSSDAWEQHKRVLQALKESAKGDM